MLPARWLSTRAALEAARFEGAPAPGAAAARV